ncbi:MAG: glycosyltransferase family 4 protein [Terriglobales bacterium]
MNRRVVILTEIIAPYRIPVFNALARFDGIDLHVIFLAETDATTRGWLVYKNEIRFSHQVLPSYRTRLFGKNILLNVGIGAALRKARADVIICGGYNYVAFWRAWFWSRRHEVPFLLWAESNARDRRRNAQWIEHLKSVFIRRCDGFVVPGAASREYLKSFNIAEERVFTAPNAVDNGLFEAIAGDTRRDAAKWRLQLGLPQRFFLFVGRLVRAKGVFDLLRAYNAMDAQLRNQIGLVFVGGGDARAELERLARNFKSVSIQFSGFVQRDNLARYYALAEALIFPTHSDPWGLVVNEGMACGLPVVCTEAAGCATDLVRDLWNGRIIPSGDVKQLTQALDEMGSDLGRSQAMGENSRNLIRNFSPEICARGIAEAISLTARVNE